MLFITNVRLKWIKKPCNWLGFNKGTEASKKRGVGGSSGSRELRGAYSLFFSFFPFFFLKVVLFFVLNKYRY